ncbi:unnamed protein product, partial [Didymodactylos carnosus]
MAVNYIDELDDDMKISQAVTEVIVNIREDRDIDQLILSVIIWN